MSEEAGKVVPNAIYVGVGAAGVAGVGTKQDINANLILKGPNAGKVVYTYTGSAGAGLNLGLGFNFGTVYKDGDLRVNDFATRSWKGAAPTTYGSFGLSAGGKLGLSGSYTPGGIYTGELNVGFGPPSIGFGSVGVSNTIIIGK